MRDAVTDGGFRLIDPRTWPWPVWLWLGIVLVRTTRDSLIRPIFLL